MLPEDVIHWKFNLFLMIYFVVISFFSMAATEHLPVDLDEDLGVSQWPGDGSECV